MEYCSYLSVKYQLLYITINYINFIHQLICLYIENLLLLFMFKSITGDLKQKYFLKKFKNRNKTTKTCTLTCSNISPIGIPAVIGRYNFLLQF